MLNINKYSKNAYFLAAASWQRLLGRGLLGSRLLSSLHGRLLDSLYSLLGLLGSRLLNLLLNSKTALAASTVLLATTYLRIAWQEDPFLSENTLMAEAIVTA